MTDLVPTTSGSLRDTWWVISTDTLSNVLALGYADEDTVGLLAIIPGPVPTTEHIDPKDVTSATSMAIVDREWVDRAASNTTAVLDGQRRLREIVPAAASARAVLTTFLSAVTEGQLVVTSTDDSEDAWTPTGALSGLDAIAAALVPTKGGIIPL